MNDTVQKLMGLADVYADRFHEDRKRHTPETVHDRSAARIAMQDGIRELLAQQQAVMGQALEVLEDCRDECEESHNTVAVIKALEDALK